MEVPIKVEHNPASRFREVIDKIGHISNQTTLATLTSCNGIVPAELKEKENKKKMNVPQPSEQTV